MYDNGSRTLRRRLKAGALTVTQKKENDDERTDTSSGSQILGAGGNDRSHLCGADPAFFAYFLWPHTISDFRGIVYFALFYTGGSSGPLCRMPDL